MKTKNIDLMKPVTPSDSDLKELIVEFVGNKISPANDEVTVENIINVFAEQFPEFLLVIAEENWVNGYTQALNDVKYTESEMQKKASENHVD